MMKNIIKEKHIERNKQVNFAILLSSKKKTCQKQFSALRIHFSFQFDIDFSFSAHFSFDYDENKALVRNVS